MGKILFDLDDIEARWKRYTESLRKDKSNASGDKIGQVM